MRPNGEFKDQLMQIQSKDQYTCRSTRLLGKKRVSPVNDDTCKARDSFDIVYNEEADARSAIIKPAVKRVCFDSQDTQISQ